MAPESEPPVESYENDPASVFAAAHSLWETFHDKEEHRISDGMVGFMSDIMHVANLFESWACDHVIFEEMSDVWPYLLQDKFGEACQRLEDLTDFRTFNEADCLRVAMNLRLPIRLDDKLPVPVDVAARNTVPGSGFREFRIQTVRDVIDEDEVAAFGWGDDPFDSDYGAPFFSLYGIGEDGLSEHIADRKTYADAVKLAEKLAPAIDFPTTPTPNSKDYSE